MRKKTKRVIGKFYSVPHKKYLSKKITHFGDSPFRSDLHPKWSPDSKSICVDSVCGGNRNMYEVAIDE